jgi:catechol 2,3-dioxygenase-like lactoylglutathione lyase family enzyme
MSIRGLGYVGIGASNLSEWTDFATNWLGMQMIERGNTARAFRMDDHEQRLVVDRSLADGDRYFGFEIEDAAALDALAAKLEAAKIKVTRGPASLAAQRFVSGLISFRDPGGNRLEALLSATTSARHSERISCM